VLARIDDRDFKTALAQAQADVASADGAIRNLAAQIVLQGSVIDQEQANITAADAALAFARQEQVRYDALAKTGNGSVQNAQQSDSALRQKGAALTASRAALVAAQQKIDVLTTQRQQAEAARAHAQAVADQAALNLSYTTIIAPVDGTVGARSLRVGQYVQAGTALMAVVPLHAVYIVANYKETQLTHVRGGQPVTLSVDTFPGVRVRGHVDSVAPASGLEFALLPPDNATGNFTKIVQRIPVKILVDQGALQGLLRPGMSVEPRINTKPAAEPARTAGSSTPAG
jgi:membrane fusion protein (multidrug efflux system)